MIGRPEHTEAAPNYFTYIDVVAGDDILLVLQEQLDASVKLFATISEQRSLFRYAPEKWTIRELVNHITDTERAFAFRALWFARGFSAPLPGFDQDMAAVGAEANHRAWSDHVEEFRQVRVSTLTLFRNLPAEAWMRRGRRFGMASV